MRIHKRGRARRKAFALLLAGILAVTGASALAAAAFAGQRPSRSQAADSRQAGARPGTVACADVGTALNSVPESAQQDVDQDLADLDVQVADAYRSLSEPGSGGGEQQVMGELAGKRTATLRKLVASAGPDSGLPQDVSALATCAIRRDLVTDASAEDYAPDGGSDAAGQNGGTGQSGAAAPKNLASGGRNGLGRGFVDIRTVTPNTARPTRTGPADGTFTSRCGLNENRHLNPDNVIVAPGVSNGAHHMHDYVGNLVTDAFSTNGRLANAGTTCSDGDQSAYYWPVLRVLDGRAEKDARAPGGGKDRNVGSILQPAEVGITYDSPAGNRVQPMTRFLRIITGDAKALTNGPANAHASWSCTGFEDRQLADKYPLCPSGSRVVRTLKFPDCWDGRNTDSANHRTHTAFSRADGSCPRNFRAIPRLTERIAYDVPAGERFAVDTFPEQLHNPITDHGDFINVMSRDLLDQMATCINEGRRCG
ncbi:DUF1996 domain-containing protein [Streptomyces sp. SP17BM10]|uniref:DUF1996 domain-containing protein n=1 Tax=Streptomyces sp. SP17BM10 TaxID=3002530 RepID=UPI002E796E76|nr:DUF1996 domain-containing protein [Streptomyces sp. SP17BM10]MEE1786627.1 DUF1996 domain-containing protein [Streptomyces sp. SP17BM10]